MRARRRYRYLSDGALYRGVSRPVITFTLERLMDKAAAALGTDPVEIRRRNLIDNFYTLAAGLVFDQASYKQTLEMLRSRPSTCRLPHRQRRRAASAAYLGIGFATFS